VVAVSLHRLSSHRPLVHPLAHLPQPGQPHQVVLSQRRLVSPLTARAVPLLASPALVPVSGIVARSTATAAAPMVTVVMAVKRASETAVCLPPARPLLQQLLPVHLHLLPQLVSHQPQLAALLHPAL
jgi:hypothetical protein